VVSWKIIKAETPYGWLGTSADRIARGLVLEGIAERKRDGKYTYYRLKDRKRQDTLIDLRPIITV